MNTNKIILNDINDTVGIGAFLGIRGVGGFGYEEGIKLDAILGQMSSVALSALSMQLNQSMHAIKQVYPDIKNNEYPKKPSFKVQREVSKFSRYSDYVKSKALLPVDFIQAVSALNYSEGKDKNYFYYENGVVMCRLKEEDIPAHQASLKCEAEFRAKNLDVKVQGPDRLDRYARKTHHTQENVTAFLNSAEKEMNNVSLVDMAKVVAIGQLDIVVGANKVKASENNKFLKTYMYSGAKELQVFHTDQNGRKFNGDIIEKSSIFIKDGYDTAGLGIKKQINKAIIEKLGLDPDMEDGMAKLKFFNTLYDIEKDKKEGKPPGEEKRVVLFNPSWLAEEYSKTKNNEYESEKFKNKYSILLKSTPLYLGTGCYSYAIRLDDRESPMPTVIFMNSFSMCERFVGYYNLYRTFFDKKTFKEVLAAYIKYQNMYAVGALMKDMLYYGTQKIDFTVDFIGVSKNKEDKGSIAADVFNKTLNSKEQGKIEEELSSDIWKDNTVHYVPPSQTLKKNGKPIKKSDQEYESISEDPQEEVKKDAVKKKENKKIVESSSSSEELSSSEDPWGLKGLDMSPQNKVKNKSKNKVNKGEEIYAIKKNMGKAFKDRNFKGLIGEDLLEWYLRGFLTYTGWEEDYYDQFVKGYDQSKDKGGPIRKRVRSYVKEMLGKGDLDEELDSFEADSRFDQFKDAENGRPTPQNKVKKKKNKN